MIKKELIMEKALELFANQGFEATSVQQITEQCRMSKGAFYLSFKSKDELILALIDHFMMQITSDIDHIVNQTEDDKLLYQFFYTSLKMNQKHSDFAKIFIKEKVQSNEGFIKKMHYYEGITERNILSMVERLYGKDIVQTKYDLVYCINGFLKHYSVLFLFYNIPLDITLLTESLVEKTNVLAKHISIPFITGDLVELIKPAWNEATTKEQIQEMIEKKIKELNESIEKESLVILKQQLEEQTLSRVLIKGLVENIHYHPHCKWLSYSLRQYYKF